MISKQLREFELLNTTTQSIYELNELKVLIILKDGSNLTDWSFVENKDDIIYISEDLFGITDLTGRYEDLINLKAIVAFGFGEVHNMERVFKGCESLADISSLKSWDVSNVVSMASMFEGCQSLSDISALSGCRSSLL